MLQTFLNEIIMVVIHIATLLASNFYRYDIETPKKGLRRDFNKQFRNVQQKRAH